MVQAPLPSVPAIPVTPVVETTTAERTRDISMIDVTVAAFGLTGYIMSAALIAGLLAGAGYVWFRSRRPVSTIEARGGNANFLRGD